MQRIKKYECRKTNYALIDKTGTERNEKERKREKEKKITIINRNNIMYIVRQKMKNAKLITVARKNKTIRYAKRKR